MLFVDLNIAISTHTYQMKSNQCKCNSQSQVMSTLTDGYGPSIFCGLVVDVLVPMV